MPAGTLYLELRNAIDRIVEKRAGSGIAQQAPVDSVLEDGTAVARVDGRPVRVRMATEEPLLPGEPAWISKTQDGQYIAHGGAH